MTNSHTSAVSYLVDYSEMGSHLKISRKTGKGTQRGGGIRGQVSGFSRQSRGRMFQRLSKIDRQALGSAKVLTLTYPRAWPANPRTWKRNLSDFGEAMRGKHPKISAVWKLEPQKRGAPHFHLLVMGAKEISQEWCKETWYGIVGSLDPRHLKRGAHLRRVKRKRNAIAYVGKYVAKVQAMTDSTSGEIYNWDYPGRWWGVIGRAELPAQCETLRVSAKVWYAIKRPLHAFMVRRGRPKSFDPLGGGGWVILNGERAVALLRLTGALEAGGR